MKLTIVKDDNLVIIDRQPMRFDLSSFKLAENFHALQWFEDHGEEEFNDGTPNSVITDIEVYQPIIDEYYRLEDIANNPPEPTEEKLYAQLVSQRNQYLAITDWLIRRNNDQLQIEAPVDLEHSDFLKLQHWRQALRDLPEHYPTSEDWVWPEVPAFLVPGLVPGYPASYAGNEG